MQIIKAEANQWIQAGAKGLWIQAGAKGLRALAHGYRKVCFHNVACNKKLTTASGTRCISNSIPSNTMIHTLVRIREKKI
jgi:hypothetical protein